MGLSGSTSVQTPQAWLSTALTRSGGQPSSSRIRFVWTQCSSGYFS